MLGLLIAILLVATAAGQEVGVDRPAMRQFSGGGSLAKPPSQRELVDAKAVFRERYRGQLANVRTSARAMEAADSLRSAAVDEPDLALKWLLLDEARELAAAAGNAAGVTAAIRLAAAVYDFDELNREFESLETIPLRALDPGRLAMLAETAADLATRAETDDRLGLAEDAQFLCYKAWQRTGNLQAARNASLRHAEIVEKKGAGR